MGRFALVGLLVGCPSVALAQSVAIAVFVGASQSIPQSTSFSSECGFRPDDCPHTVTTTRSIRSAVGSRITAQINRYFGFDAVVYHSRGTFETRAGALVQRGRVAATFVAVQAHRTIPLNAILEGVLGAGPAVAAVSDLSDGLRCGAAFSLGLRAHLPTGIMLDVGATDTHLLGPPSTGNRNHLVYGVSIGYAMIR